MRGIFVFLLFFLLTGCDHFFSVSDVEYVSRAEDYIDNGELKSASIELKNALSKNPQNPRARWLLGKLYLEIGHAPGAEKELTRASELGVSDQSVLPLLAKSMLAQGKEKEVLALKPLSAISDAATAELLAARGLAYMAQDDQENAARELTAALSANPNSVYALVGRASLFASIEDYERAQGYLDKVFFIDGEYVPAWRLQGNIKRILNQSEEAIEAYTQAINNNKFTPNNDILSRAKLYIQEKRFEEAQQDIDILKTRVPNHPGVNYINGLNLYLQNRISEAQESFEFTLQVDGNYMPAVFYLGAAHFQQSHPKKAMEYLSRYVDANPNHALARKLLAVLEMQEKDYQRVEELVRPIVAVNNDDALALNLLANALLARGKTEQGIGLLQRVVELEPESAKAKTRLGVGLLMEGEQQAALQNLRAAIELDPNFQQADVLLGMYYLRKQAFDQAEAVAEDFVKRQPDNPVAHNLLGLIYHGQKKTDEARKAFSLALKSAPGDPAASHNLAAFAEKDSQPDQARAYYEDVLKHHENHLQTLLRLAILEARQGDVDAMVNILQGASVVHPHAVEPKVLLAQNYFRSGNLNEARGLLSDIEGEQQNNAAVLGILAEIQLATQDNVMAKITLEKLVEQRPNYAEGHFLLSKAYRGLNDLEQAKQQLSKTLSLAPDHNAARLDQTRLLILNNEIEQARKNLEILKSTAPEDPDVLAIEGFFNIQEGKLNEGLVNLQQRFDTSPNTKTLFELVRLKWAIGKQQEALNDLERWTEAHPEDVAARLALAEYHLNLQQNDAALAQYENVLALSENNLVALNNLAWNLRDSDIDKAQAYAEKAYSLTPDSAATMDTLASILLATGDLQRAQRLNERALEKSPESPTFLYRRALILEAFGNKQESLAEIKSLLEKNEKFPEHAKAKRMLSRLIGSSSVR